MKQRWIFCPKLNEIIDDLHKIADDKEYSGKTKLALLRFVFEWIIIDFCYRMKLSSISQKAKIFKHNEFVEFIHKKKQVPTFLKEIEEKYKDYFQDITSETIINQCWDKLKGNYHWKYDYKFESKVNDYKNCIDYIDKLQEIFKNIWLNEKWELSFHSKKTNNKSHIKRSSDSEYFCVGAEKMKYETKNSLEHTIEINTKDLINNYFYKINTLRSYIKLKPSGQIIMICNYCIKTLFGIFQELEEINFSNTLYYINELMEGEYI